MVQVGRGHGGVLVLAAVVVDGLGVVASAFVVELVDGLAEEVAAGDEVVLTAVFVVELLDCFAVVVLTLGLVVAPVVVTGPMQDTS